jgi:RND family efflux transporter MFP subunit
MSRRILPVTWLVALLFAYPLATAALDLETAGAEYVTVPAEMLLEGVVEAVNQATVSAQTSGRVTEIRYDIDDFVPKGEVIVRLADVEQQARLARAKGGLQEVQARYENAAIDLRRKQTLLQREAGSQASVDAANAEFKAAKAALAAARAQLAESAEQLDQTLIRSPYSGIVVERHIETGELVQPGSLLMTGLSLDSLRVTAQVPESLIGALRINKSASVLLPGTAGERVVADKLTLSPRADAMTHTFEMRLQLPPLDAPLYPGMSVKVAVTTSEAPRLLVPVQAIVYRSEVAGVYVVDDRGVHFRQVRPGRRYLGDRQEVLAGLAAGEQVALDPVRAVIQLKSQQPGQADE